MFKMDLHPIFEYLQTPVINQSRQDYFTIFVLYFRVLLALPILGSGGVRGILIAMLSWCCPGSWCQTSLAKARWLSCDRRWRRTVWWTTWPTVTLEDCPKRKLNRRSLITSSSPCEEGLQLIRRQWTLSIIRESQVMFMDTLKVLQRLLKSFSLIQRGKSLKFQITLSVECAIK